MLEVGGAKIRGGAVFTGNTVHGYPTGQFIPHHFTLPNLHSV